MYTYCTISALSTSMGLLLNKLLHQNSMKEINLCLLWGVLVGLLVTRLHCWFWSPIFLMFIEKTGNKMQQWTVEHLGENKTTGEVHRDRKLVTEKSGKEVLKLSDLVTDLVGWKPAETKMENAAGRLRSWGKGRRQKESGLIRH